MARGVLLKRAGEGGVRERESFLRKHRLREKEVESDDLMKHKRAEKQERNMNGMTTTTTMKTTTKMMTTTKRIARKKRVQ